MIYLDIIPVKDGRGRIDGFVLYQDKEGRFPRHLCFGSLKTLQELAHLLDPDAKVHVHDYPVIRKSALSTGW